MQPQNTTTNTTTTSFIFIASNANDNANDTNESMPQDPCALLGRRLAEWGSDVLVANPKSQEVTATSTNMTTTIPAWFYSRCVETTTTTTKPASCTREAKCNSRGYAWTSSWSNDCVCYCDYPFGGATCKYTPCLQVFCLRVRMNLQTRNNLSFLPALKLFAFLNSIPIPSGATTTTPVVCTTRRTPTLLFRMLAPRRWRRWPRPARERELL